MASAIESAFVARRHLDVALDGAVPTPSYRYMFALGIATAKVHASQPIGISCL